MTTANALQPLRTRVNLPGFQVANVLEPTQGASGDKGIDGRAVGANTIRDDIATDSTRPARNALPRRKSDLLARTGRPRRTP